jgi:geranylgeranyl diphosphate synthase, type II
MAVVSPDRNPQTRFAPLRELVEKALARYLQPVPGCPERLADAMRYSALAPGKRLRPVLALLAAEATGGNLQSAIPVACAIELIHAYSLIHDDLPAMDNDDLRRGLPTCHRQFDEATAILAGDALQALAFEIVAHDLPDDQAIRCCRILSRACGRSFLVGGQADDLAAEGRFGDQAANGRSAEHLQNIHLRKTGAIIQASLSLGGVAAGASSDHLEMLDKFGRAIGLAFQVVDDCLDVESTSEQMGKNTRKDSVLGKLTYPSLIGLDASRRWAEQLVAEACDALAPLGAAANNLTLVAKFVVERNT